MILSIIILNYRTPRLTLKLLESVSRNYKEELDNNKFEIIVVDNASGDDSPQIIKGSKYSPLIKFIENKENFGFGEGNNIASKKVDGELILFINSDTLPHDRSFLKMIDFIHKNKDAGILGGRLIDKNGRDISPAGKFFSLPHLFLTLYFSKLISSNNSNSKGVINVDWVSGAFMMVRRKVFEETGGFDKNIFMYAEDMELCYRIKKLGYSIVFLPESFLYHDEHGSSNRSFAIINIYRGILYFYRKHKSPFSYYIVKLMLTFKAVVLVIVGKMLNNKYLVATYREALKI